MPSIIQLVWHTYSSHPLYSPAIGATVSVYATAWFTRNGSRRWTLIWRHRHLRCHSPLSAINDKTHPTHSLHNSALSTSASSALCGHFYKSQRCRPDWTIACSTLFSVLTLPSSAAQALHASNFTRLEDVTHFKERGAYPRSSNVFARRAEISSVNHVHAHSVEPKRINNYMSHFAAPRV